MTSATEQQRFYENCAWHVFSQRRVCCNEINGYFIIGIETLVLGGFVPDPRLQTCQPSPRAGISHVRRPGLNNLALGLASNALNKSSGLVYPYLSNQWSQSKV